MYESLLITLFISYGIFPITPAMVNRAVESMLLPEHDYADWVDALTISAFSQLGLKAYEVGETERDLIQLIRDRADVHRVVRDQLNLQGLLD